MSLLVRKAAVLGAGVMGAQIAAHLANADVPVLLFDLPAKEGDPSGVSKRAIENLKKLSPPPAAVALDGNFCRHRERRDRTSRLSTARSNIGASAWILDDHHRIDRRRLRFAIRPIVSPRRSRRHRMRRRATSPA